MHRCPVSTLTGAVPAATSLPCLRPLAVALLASAVLLAASDAWALKLRGIGKAAGVAGAGAAALSGQPALSKEQLRECLAKEKQLGERAAPVKREQARLEGLRTSVDTLDAMILANKPADLRANKTLAKSHEGMVDRRKKLAAEFNAAVPEFKLRSQEVQSLSAAFNVACAEKSYRESDMAALKAGG